MLVAVSNTQAQHMTCVLGCVVPEISTRASGWKASIFHSIVPGYDGQPILSALNAAGILALCRNPQFSRYPQTFTNVNPRAMKQVNYG